MEYGEAIFVKAAFDVGLVKCDHVIRNKDFVNITKNQSSDVEMPMLFVLCEIDDIDDLVKEMKKFQE
ncbi:hypothetical protein ACI3LX_005293 [Candidozyma auris]